MQALQSSVPNSMSNHNLQLKNKIKKGIEWIPSQLWPSAKGYFSNYDPNQLC